MPEVGFGVLIGFMTVLIRVINPAFPEGIMRWQSYSATCLRHIDHVVIQANIKRRLARV